MELPTLRISTCEKQVAQFRDQLGRLNHLSKEQRAAFLSKMQAFVESLSLTNNVVMGAGLGLAAAVLPVIGWFSGPLIGGLYCGYRSRQLAKYRKEVEVMIQLLTR